MRFIPGLVSEIVEQHAAEASFLWGQRSDAVDSSAFSFAELCELDERVEAHLDGLFLAGDLAWDTCVLAIDADEPGTAFAAACVALKRDDPRAFAEVLDRGAGQAPTARAISSALGWLPFDQVARALRGLLFHACPPELHYLGIGASAMHRRDPGAPLTHALSSPLPRLRRRALRAVGELALRERRLDLQAALEGDDDDGCRFRAAWSGMLLGVDGALNALQQLASGEGNHAAEAATAAVRRMETDEAARWLRELGARGPESTLAALAGASALGDPRLVPWLLEAMQDPTTARRAGEAFAFLTGVDMTTTLSGAPPEDFRNGPSDEAGEDDVAVDPDLDLPWPHVEAAAAWWHAHRSRFSAGTRYLAGLPLTTPWLQKVLRTGQQPQRASAAYELALRQPGSIPFEVRAPSPRQRHALG